ncbi:amidohydrolase [Fusibacter tunisiensis]|uniref:Imidazolonepropionase-like amidohydrolase n=1 Tax=Fusibacter tunisiensis TaxID=1008308 RepID=A0ABS2MPV5_9FIRM|nr:amidohydrolase [Fusibacter tunisiensis]MBM7561347.1 imidazolonepropionase-like amidohydrolase [Fusibacter tunisiensis]
MIFIKNAKIYTITNGIIENGCILVDDGKIKEIGSDLVAPLDAEVIDAGGKNVFPGFIDAHCHIGMWEEGIGFEGSDGNEMTDPVTPHLRAIDAINPMDEAFTNAIQGGVTTAATGPGSANVIGGVFSVIKLHGDRVDDMVVRETLAMKCAFGENPKRVYADKKMTPMTRMGTAAKLRETLAKAFEYNQKKEAAGDDASKMPAYDMKLEAMLPVVKGEIPLKAHAHRADDIFTSIRIAKEFGVKLTLEHCTEGHLIADHLAKEGYPAIVGPSFGNKSKFELNKKTFDTPKVMVEAGCKIAIMTDSPVIPLEYLPMCAALAHRVGLEEVEALKAITINAAEILEVSDRLGSLEAGKDADIVIWEGHPFDLQAKVAVTLVNGEVVYRKS